VLLYRTAKGLKPLGASTRASPAAIDLWWCSPIGATARQGVGLWPPPIYGRQLLIGATVVRSMAAPLSIRVVVCPSIRGSAPMFIRPPAYLCHKLIYRGVVDKSNYRNAIFISCIGDIVDMTTVTYAAHTN
jgi:hypothetical protein